MIPPSIVLIFYGLITETSIHALFKAAFLPGFILAIPLGVFYGLIERHGAGLMPASTVSGYEPSLQTAGRSASAIFSQS